MEKKKIKSLIIYGLNENNIDINNINAEIIDTVIEDYFFLCNDFKTKYVKGELDTFKKAACLLTAISKCTLTSDKRLNISIAIDASEKMCEKPYWNVGKNFDIPHKLEEVDFKSLFENDKYSYDKHRSMLTDSVLYADGNISPVSIYLNLELFYRIGVELKKKKTGKTINNINNLSTYSTVEQNNVQDTDTSIPKRKRKLFSLFRK